MSCGEVTPPPAHALAVRVYYEDTDAAGIVYHANYLRFAERGRTEWLRSLGFDHRRLAESAGLGFAVRRCHADFMAPARLDDALTVETRLTGFGAATLVLAQTIVRDARSLALIDVLVACIGRDGRPKRLPAALRATLSRFRQLSPKIVQKTP